MPMLALMIVSRSATKAIADVSAVSVRRLYRGGGRFRFVVRTGVSIAAFLPFPLSPVITVVVYSLVFWPYISLLVSLP
jgi:hypothetical protein